MCLVACDRVGPERGVEWVGGSVLVDADGWVVAGGAASTEAVTVMAELDLGKALDKGVGGLSDVFADRRPDLYGGVAAP